MQIGSGPDFTTVFLSRTVQVGPAAGLVAASEQLGAGFNVAPNTAICPGSLLSGSNTGISARLIEFALRGYLINAH